MDAAFQTMRIGGLDEDENINFLLTRDEPQVDNRLVRPKLAEDNNDFFGDERREIKTSVEEENNQRRTTVVGDVDLESRNEDRLDNGTNPEIGNIAESSSSIINQNPQINQKVDETFVIQKNSSTSSTMFKRSQHKSITRDGIDVLCKSNLNEHTTADPMVPSTSGYSVAGMRSRKETRDTENLIKPVDRPLSRNYAAKNGVQDIHSNVNERGLRRKPVEKPGKPPKAGFITIPNEFNFSSQKRTRERSLEPRAGRSRLDQSGESVGTRNPHRRSASVSSYTSYREIPTSSRLLQPTQSSNLKRSNSVAHLEKANRVEPLNTMRPNSPTRNRRNNSVSSSSSYEDFYRRNQELVKKRESRIREHTKKQYDKKRPICASSTSNAGQDVSLKQIDQEILENYRKWKEQRGKIGRELKPQMITLPQPFNFEADKRGAAKQRKFIKKRKQEEKRAKEQAKIKTHDIPDFSNVA